MTRMFCILVPLHFKAASSAMYVTNRAPLDFTWITLQVVPHHSTESVTVRFEKLMAAFIAYYAMVALAF